jgi:hypothetical protein
MSYMHCQKIFSGTESCGGKEYQFPDKAGFENTTGINFNQKTNNISIYQSPVRYSEGIFPVFRTS